MRVTIVENTFSTQHGQVGIALHEAGAAINLIKPRLGDALPLTVDSDALVVFGGEQRADDDAAYPYLKPLAGLMRAYSEAGKAVLGVCLGSQILARAFGGQNLAGITREFGWCEVNRTAEGAQDPVMGAVSDNFHIYQMHTDTFTLPEGAVRLASSAIAENQCFRIGAKTYGMQFHFEANRNVAAAWNRDFPEVIEEMRPGWVRDMPREAAKYGADADASGLALARAWVALV
ncbi:type 1 glutamine amidotransferase [Pseudogemmobacter faecipullorum]|uniref:Type 1 glutamine amidotransferase n=1 Tax=Pseudogemmobacter faecipullorum TaxID=2755041 RepID=A0ABS8CK92_9RHOB|nr:type 1 glutamine amidotransferase [Pseudogemmobacter faecipullorum]MCB5409795.1 type 1 glutamine amidotransferase [Pseudogemmobacter faecipullorum]